MLAPANTSKCIAKTLQEPAGTLAPLAKKSSKIGLYKANLGQANQNVSTTTVTTPKHFHHYSNYTKTFPPGQLHVTTALQPPLYHLPTCDLDEVLPGEAGPPQSCSSHPGYGGHGLKIG